MADKKDVRTPAQRLAEEKKSKATDPEEEKIEQKRIALKTPDPADFKTAAARQALYRLNAKAATKDDTAIDTAQRYAKEVKAKPFVYKKGGKVISGGIAKVHEGERVLTKAQANTKRISCKR